MASIGLKNIVYAPHTTDTTTSQKYGTSVNIVGAIEMGFSPNIAEASLYADDVLSEYDAVFTDGTLTLGIANDDATVFAALLGEDTESVTVATSTTVSVKVSSVNDIPSSVGIGFIVPVSIQNAKKWKVFAFLDVTFKPYSQNARTKGSTLEYTTPSVEGKVKPNALGEWKREGLCDSLEDAQELLGKLFPTT